MPTTDISQALYLYEAACKWFTIIPPLSTPFGFLIDAPFGRFSPTTPSIFLVDGIKSWILMELVSPITFVYAYMNSPISPLTAGTSPSLSLSYPPTFLAALYLIHYFNRSLVSPLRTPSRSKSHIMVPFFAVTFNIVNGSLMGAYLSSPLAHSFLQGAYNRPLFWLGVGTWALGFAGNILHDEILLNLRRSAKAKGKGKDSDDNNNGKNKQEHYAIPHGYLYKYISYPNYFCEWVEWFGFALAAAPPPSFASAGDFLATMTPPFIFVMSEVFLMINRAYKGHRWYLNRFPDYPRERKAVIPFLF